MPKQTCVAWINIVFLGSKPPAVTVVRSFDDGRLVQRDYQCNRQQYERWLKVCRRRADESFRIPDGLQYWFTYPAWERYFRSQKGT